MQLQNFDIDLFLRDYWQKKPFLIRSALKGWTNPIEPDELAGLSCEDDIESRLIVQNNGWTLNNGPFEDSDFFALEGEIYSLLVQAADQYIPDVGSLLNLFRFIPNWRIDDVMVSYANIGGGVGPHYDQYDVFLVQGLGKRRWQIGQICDENTALLEHEGLRLIKGFDLQNEWTLEAGDILYIPPFVAHNGISASDDCMTYSIGFRSPSQSEIIGHYCDYILDNMKSDPRFIDAGYTQQTNPGEITRQSMNGIFDMMNEKIGDRRAFSEWFGKYNSEAKYPDLLNAPEQIINIDNMRDLLANGTMIERNSASRFIYTEQDDGCVSLYVDNVHHMCSPLNSDFARSLCSYQYPEVTLGNYTISHDILTLIIRLYKQGSIKFIHPA